MIPADQVMEALCRLELSDDPSAMMALLHFASEEEVRDVLLDGVPSETGLRAKSFFKTCLTESEFDEISEENLALLEEAAKTLTEKISCTAEIESEKDGIVTVKLNLHYIRLKKDSFYYTNRVDAEMTEAEQMQRAMGNMAAKQKYYQLLISYFLNDVKTLEAVEEPRELSVVCQKTTLIVNGMEQTVWMPEDRLDFSIMLAQAAIKY